MPTTDALSGQLAAIAAQTAKAAEAHSDEDSRAYFLAVLDRLDWTQTDERWRVAVDLLEYDKHWSRADDDLARELLDLIVQITGQAQEMIERRSNASSDKETQMLARDLRDATDILHRIVYAVTAVHSLGSAQS
ncbi:MAG: hypothetical protein M3Q31_12690 [Actinomycetota bacterium]|nr:hypothetical protein [Actinomycetota bacterium]